VRDQIQLTRFRQLCKDFFVIWNFGLKISVPPKVHSINFHLGDEAEMMGNLSDSLEETMESLHVEDNRANKRLSAITNILKKEKAKMRRLGQESLPETQAELDIMKNRKRIISSAVATDRDQKAAAMGIQQKNRLESSLSTVRKFSLKLLPEVSPTPPAPIIVAAARLNDPEGGYETENDEEIEEPDEEELDEDALAAIDSLFGELL
jgi:hypothetical protein